MFGAPIGNKRKEFVSQVFFIVQKSKRMRHIHRPFSAWLRKWERTHFEFYKKLMPKTRFLS
jgi:murein L,D-transpeptidase YafK